MCTYAPTGLQVLLPLTANTLVAAVRLDRQTDNEMAALAGRAVELQFAPVGADQVVGDGQPKPHAVGEAPGSLATEERLEDAPLFIGADAGACVADVDEQFAAKHVCRDDHHPPRRGITDSVAD